jgi:hypothetical protein
MGMGAVPVEAQQDYRPLFDRFNFRLEGSVIGLKTEIRLDSKTTGDSSPGSAGSISR